MDDGFIQTIIGGIFTIVAAFIARSGNKGQTRETVRTVYTQTPSNQNTGSSQSSSGEDDSAIGVLVYILLVVGFSFYWVPKIGWAQGIGWSLIAPLYWYMYAIFYIAYLFYYKFLWCMVIVPLWEHFFAICYLI